MSLIERLSGRLPAISKSPASDVVRGYISKIARRRKLQRRLMVLVLAAPTILAAIYYGLIATPRYVSESSFVVRGVVSGRVSGLDAFFRTFGVSRAADDAHVVQSYILSRDALVALSAKLPVRDILSRPEADFIARFPTFWQTDTFEQLYRTYLRRVSVQQEATKGISTLSVETFRADDSRMMVEELMRLAEAKANDMTRRAQESAVSAAQREMSLAESQIVSAQAELTAFRNTAALVDPTRSSDATLATVSALTSELTQTLVSIASTQRLAPTSPSLGVDRARSEALRVRIQSEREKLGGDDQALANKVSTYERLTLVRDLADKSLASAAQALELARNEARRQQVYIERIAEPNLPDVSTEPQRLRMVFSVLVLSLMAYSVIWILTVGAKEHAQ